MHTGNSRFTILDSVDSTNNYAMGMVHAGLAKHGDAWFTVFQTNGKGQRGKHWQSANGENIAISIVIEPHRLKISQQFQLSVAAALATFNFFTKYALNEVQIKWPNDIYWRDRKAAGILIENVIGPQQLNESSWKYAVVGIGVNINQTIFDEALLNPVSLKQITGKHYNCTALGKELQQFLLQEVAAIMEGKFEDSLLNYNHHLYKKNCTVVLKKGDILFETTVKSVNEEGRLLTTDVIDNVFNFGEVAWILK